MYNARNRAVIHKICATLHILCITARFQALYISIESVIHIDRVRYTYRSSPLYISGGVMHIVIHINFRREYFNYEPLPLSQWDLLSAVLGGLPSHGAVLGLPSPSKSRSNGYRGSSSIKYPISYDLPIIGYGFRVIG